MSRIKTLFLSAILLFGFGQSVLASDFIIPTTPTGGDYGFSGILKDLDSNTVFNSSYGAIMPPDAISIVNLVVNADCASTPENYWNNNFDVYTSNMMAQFDNTGGYGFTLDTNTNQSFITPISNYNGGQITELCKYWYHATINCSSGNGCGELRRYFDFSNLVPLPPTVMLSPTSTISFIITPVISQITNLARTVLADWWIYILVFGIVAVFMTKFRDLISIFTGGNRKNPTGYNKELNSAYHRHKSVKRWHKRAMQAYVRPKYGFESYQHEKKLPKKHRVYRGKD